MKPNRPRWVVSLVAAAAVATSMVSATPAAQAEGLTLPQVVSPIPQSGTPNVDDGQVLTFTQVGGRVFAGGTFTSVAGSARRGVLGMQGPGYALAADFNPAVDGDVNALLPGPVPGTMYLGGAFKTVGGVTSKALALVDATTGARVTSFRASFINGIVQTIKRSGNQLIIGGTFTTVNGQPRGGLASLDATTGDLTPFVTNAVTVNHSWTPTNGAQKGAVGVEDLVITPDGSKLVAIGNFKSVDGLPRDQVVMIDLGGTSAVVRPDWATHRYEPACYSASYDSYIRDVDMSADGSYFVIAASGGGRDTLCDNTARFETNAVGQDVQPTWANAAGGDSQLSVAIAGDVIYAGGHARWSNNVDGNDYPGPGAVPRPGLSALDARTGMPISWNPGRNPRGGGAKAAYVSTDGVWVGSDTDWVGDRRYRRQKLAFFPLTGGADLASETVSSLPAGIYRGTSATNTSVLYRVDAGGAAVAAVDNGPDWSADDADNNSYRSSGNNAAGWGPGATTDSTVPATTPNGIFDSERWDPAGGPEMHWAFPVPVGQQVEVRLYFANRCGCTSGGGTRIFNVDLDGSRVLTNFDIVAAAGDQRGTMRSFPVTSDGLVDIDFGHVVENPLVNGIEIVEAGGTTTTPASYSGYAFNGSSVGAPVTLPSVLDPTTVRGSTVIGGRLLYAKNNGDLAWRSVGANGALGDETRIDPYNDPAWSDVNTGSGGTYRGTKPDFYGEDASITSMFYDQGYLYYTLSGRDGLYYRAFSPDSGVIYPKRSQVPSLTMPAVTGAFLTGGQLYYVTAGDGRLHKVGFSGGRMTDTPASLTGAGIDGVDFRGRLFFLSAPPTAPNVLPTAAATGSCTSQACTFSSAGSSDLDGTITGYAWNFGDGTTSTDANPSHTYTAPGTYSVTLAVTDNRGGTGQASTSVTANQAANLPPTAVASGTCAQLACTFNSAGSSDPDGTVTGYAWDFGDGTTITDANPSHTYAAPGTYSVSLTVTDNRGGTGQATTSVTATQAVPSSVSYVGASSVTLSSKAPTVAVPAGVQAGDRLLLFLTTAAGGTQSAPAGWDLVTTTTSDTTRTSVWQKAAVATDTPGSPVTMTLDVFVKLDAKLVAYRSAGALVTSRSAVAAATTSHVAPGVPVATAGSWLVSYFATRSTAVTTFTPPATVIERASGYGTGSGKIDALVGDSAGSVAAGESGTRTATTDARSVRDLTVTLVLPPQ